MRCHRRHLPTIDVDGDHRRNLARIADENVTGRHVAQREQIGPGHLPGLVDEQDVVALIEGRDGQLRHRAHDDGRTDGQLIDLRQNFHIARHGAAVTARREPHDVSLRVGPSDLLAQIVDLVVGLGRHHHTQIGADHGGEGLHQVERLARSGRSLHHAQPVVAVQELLELRNDAHESASTVSKTAPSSSNAACRAGGALRSRVMSLSTP